MVPWRYKGWFPLRGVVVFSNFAHIRSPSFSVTRSVYHIEHPTGHYPYDYLFTSTTIVLCATVQSKPSLQPLRRSRPAFTPHRQTSITMTAKIGHLSSSVIAAIVAGGIFGLLAVIIIVAVILDSPKRRKRAQHKGIMEPSGKRSLEIEAEKGSVEVSVTEVSSSTNASTNYSSMRPTRPASPECVCEHPVVSPNPPRV